MSISIIGCFKSSSYQVVFPVLVYFEDPVLHVIIPGRDTIINSQCYTVLHWTSLLSTGLFCDVLPFTVVSHSFNCSWLWHATSPLAPDAKKTLKVTKVLNRAINCQKIHKRCYNLHTPRELVSPLCLSQSCIEAECVLQNYTRGCLHPDN